MTILALTISSDSRKERARQVEAVVLLALETACILGEVRRKGSNNKNREEDEPEQRTSESAAPPLLQQCGPQQVFYNNDCSHWSM